MDKRDRRKIENILREPLTRHRLSLNGKVRAAQNAENPTPFTLDDLKAFIAGIGAHDEAVRKESLNAIEAVQTGQAPKAPKFDTPETQLVWGAALSYLSVNPDQMKSWDKPPADKTPLTQTALWQQVTATRQAHQELLSHAHHVREALRDKDTRYSWGAPGTGFSFDRSKNHINIDFVQSMIVGFEHARADVYREIGHSLLSVSYPKRMQEVYKDMQPLLRKSRQAQAKKGPQLKPDEYKQLLMLSTEWELRHMMFAAAEENVANRFVSNMGKQMLQDYGVSVNNTAVTGRGVGLTRLPKDGLSDDLRRYMNLCNAVQLSFYQNNGMFDNSDTGWFKVGINPNLVRKTSTLARRPADQKEDNDGIEHPDFKQLRELAGGPKGLENLQPKQHERLYGWQNLSGRIKASDAARKDVIDEIMKLYAEDLLQRILKQANDQIDQQLKDAQEKQKQQQQDQDQDGQEGQEGQEGQDGQDQDGQEGQEGQEGQGQSGQGQGQGQGKPQKGQKNKQDQQKQKQKQQKDRGKPQGEQQDADDMDGEDADGQEGQKGQKGDKQQKQKGQKGEKGEQGEEQDADGQQGEGQEGEGQEQDGQPQDGEGQEGQGQNGEEQDADGQQQGKPENAEGKLGSDEEDTVPVEGAGDLPAPKAPTENPSDELDPNGSDASGEGNNADGEGQDADGDGQDADGDSNDADGDDADGDGQTVDDLEKELDKMDKEEQDGQDADGEGQDADGEGQDADGDGQKSKSKGKSKGKPKPSRQGGDGDGKSLEELSKQDWTNYNTRIAELAGPINRVRKLFKDVQDRQLQRKQKMSRSLDILPENGEVKDRFNAEAHLNMTIKKVTGQLEAEDLKRFHKDETSMVPTEIDIVIAIDGSGSMGNGAGGGAVPINAALQAAAIMFEAAAGKDMKMNVYVTMWGDNDPPILIKPGDDRVKIGQAMQAARKGLNSGTNFAPAVKKVAQTIGEQRGKSGTLSGFTHILVLSDGDMFDAEQSKEKIFTMFDYSDKVTFDAAIITATKNTNMQKMAEGIKGRKPYQDMGIVVGNNPEEVPMAIVGLLLEKVRKTGSFQAIPNSQKRRAMRQAHNKMDRKP